MAFKKDLARQGVRRLNENIWLLSPPVVLPFGSRFPGVNIINQRKIAQSIKDAMQELGFKRSILWTYLHTSCHLMGLLGEDFLIYDCVDEHSAYEGFNAPLVKNMERKLLQRCDLVFCTARGLYESKQAHCKEIFLSPNAADIDHFRQADSIETPVAEELIDLPHPILGFVGAIKEWIDLDLIGEVAQSFPDGSVVMVGPVGANIDISSLQGRSNVHFLGHRDRQFLPRYLKGFDVCLNPFRENELTSTVSPLKFYEYLASGRPIASVPMPEIMNFSELVEFGGGPEGFTAAISRALKDTPQKKEARLQKALENSWESRAEFMMEQIEKSYKQKMC
ncbi:glycosyltransferase [hydrocarbon metagenome]|uniref:Glycosyltransferase n=1 Tax=hydrocarbon metagenome TaxID=938273 RepID=A0A0W8E9B2_9ZZZZ